LLVAGLLVAGLGVVTPATANPFDGNCDLQGVGSIADPYMLFDESDVIDMDSCSVVTGTVHFELGNDIFMTAGIKDYERDAYFDQREDVFFDGKGFGIYGFSLGDPNGLEVGFFGDVRDLEVRDLTIVSGAMVGEDEVSVLVAEADSLVATNVVIVNDSLSCAMECGLLAGRVLGPTTVTNVTVLSAAMTAGAGSGLLVGEARGTLTIDGVVASATYHYTDDTGDMGGLIGNFNGDFQDNLGPSSITNVYIGLQSSYDQPRSYGPQYLGGVIGSIQTDSTGLSLSIEGVFVDMRVDGIQYFGGLVGGIEHLDINAQSSTVRTLALSASDILLRGSANTITAGGGISGGLLGEIYKDEAKDLITLDVTDALVSIEHDAVSGTGGTEVFSFADFNELDTFAMANALLVSEPWTSTTGNLNKNSLTGISDITEADLGVIDNVPFASTVTHPGIVGTHDWEHCPGEYPYPTFTPNACDDPVITMSANSISGPLSQAVTSITDTAAKGAGTSMLYTVEPSLPRGLHLNPVTGTISGTPVELRAARTYAIRKYNSVTNPMAQQFDNGTEAVSYFVIETTLPVIQQAQGSQPAQPAEPAAPTVYTGPILVKFSEQTIGSGQAALIAVSGERLDAITSISVDGLEVPFVASSSTSMLLSVPALSPGTKTLIVRSANGVLQHQGAFRVVEPSPTTVGPAAQKVNAGSFKGFVAIYASGYQGQRLSAKVGNDWVVVERLDSDFERVVEFTGAGFTISIPIFIDRVLVETIRLTTK
jgi:hypothetical protein